jgi:hypothetical protein
MAGRFDQYGSWRMFHVQAAGGRFDDGTNLPLSLPWLNGSMADPGRLAPEFDDELAAGWGTGRRSPFTARACLGGWTRQVKSLELTTS